jgi:hypothetical protein
VIPGQRSTTQQLLGLPALHLPNDSQLKLSAWRKSKEHFLLIKGVNKIRTVNFVTSAQAKKIFQCTNKKICYSK